MRIEKGCGRIIYDSRGVKTLEVDIYSDRGFGRAAAPFGAPGSRGEFEAPAYGERGLEGSLEYLNSVIIPNLIGLDLRDQEKIDQLLIQLDGTPNFENMGGNTASAVSIACLRAAASSLNQPLFKTIEPGGKYSLPYPLGNIIGGGAHCMGPAPDMQEHLVVPSGASNIVEAIDLMLKVHQLTGELLEKRSCSFAGGTDDENAWTADLDDVEALDILKEACDRVSCEEGKELLMGIDLAADRLWDPPKGVYRYFREKTERTPRQQFDYVSELIEKYNLVYVEDIFESNDYESFAALNEKYGKRCLICADDIYASNFERTRVGIEKKSARAMIIKPNQVGTVTGAKRTARLAGNSGLDIVLSHRSGETMDDTISHLAIAWNARMIKTGVKGGERLAKLNELVRVWKEFSDIDLIGWSI